MESRKKKGEAHLVGEFKKYRGIVIGMEAAFEVKLQDTRIPIRMIIALKKVYDRDINSWVSLYNPNALQKEYEDTIYIEHVFQAKEENIIVWDGRYNKRKKVNAKEAWQLIAYGQLEGFPVKIKNATISTIDIRKKRLNARIGIGNSCHLHINEIYQRTRLTDGQPFLNRNGEYFNHARYIYGLQPIIDI